MTRNGCVGSNPTHGTNINNFKFNKTMFKTKTIKIIFTIDEFKNLVEILPTISIYYNDKCITFRWIIFEINIYY